MTTERPYFTRKQVQEHWRLGCQVKVKQDMEIKIPDEIFGIKKWECEVVSNDNVATYIKELVVKLPEGEFLEVYIDAPLDVCESRDPKGLYKKARAGEIKHFTGIDDPYEAPENAEIVVKTGEYDLEECATQVIDYLEKNGYFESVED